MTKAEFDKVGTAYHEQVADSIAFCPLDQDFFVTAKADVLQDIFQELSLDATGGLSLLDVGCGVGGLDGVLQRRGYRVSGVDPSSEMLRLARERNPTLSYSGMTDETLPFADESFDCVFAVCVFHHIREDERRLRLLSEMRRVCKAKGVVVIIEHNPLHPLTRLSVMRCEFDRDAKLLSKEVARDVFAKTGFVKVDHKFFLFFPLNKPFLRACERKLAKLPFGAQYCAFGRKS